MSKQNKPKTKILSGTKNKGLMLIPYDRTLKKTPYQNYLKKKFNKKSPKLIYGKDKNND